MLWNAWSRIRDRIEYEKQTDGTWRAEFRGRIYLRADGVSLDDCQSRIRAVIEEQVAQMLVGPVGVVPGRGMLPKRLGAGKKRALRRH